MILRPYAGKEPRIGARCFVADNATLIGDVELAEDSSIWFGTVLRGDIHFIRVGARTNMVADGGPRPVHDAVVLGDWVVLSLGQGLRDRPARRSRAIGHNCNRGNAGEAAGVVLDTVSLR